jgi:hypothetical protein
MRLRLEPTAQQAHSVPFASIVVSMLPLPCLARHAAPHLAAPCCAGAAPLCCALYRTPRNPSARPARPAALAWRSIVCVCVLGDVMLLCRSMCFLLSGRLSFAMRLLQRSVVLAVVLLAFSVSVSGTRVVCCSPPNVAFCSGFRVPAERHPEGSWSMVLMRTQLGRRSARARERDSLIRNRAARCGVG